MIVVVSCSKKKAPRPCLAYQCYRGPYFALLLKCAFLWAKRENIYILSAKYGLVTLTTRIKPYELKMGKPGSVTANKLKRQAASRGLLSEEVVVLGGLRYVNLVRQVWPGAKAPIQDTVGDHMSMGPQMKLMNQWLARKAS